MNVGREWKLKALTTHMSGPLHSVQFQCRSHVT